MLIGWLIASTEERSAQGGAALAFEPRETRVLATDFGPLAGTAGLTLTPISKGQGSSVLQM